MVANRRTLNMGLGRAIVFRLAAVLLGLSPFLLFEGVLHVGGWGRPGDVDDPFVGFREIRPLFQRSPDGLRYEVARSRREFFRPESFAVEKGPREFRIFCLGGSTVQGCPYAIETSFTTWLELSLEAADPSRDWEVVNCGGISYASYRLVPLLRETLAYQPDLYILYTGHNEFLEARTYESVKQRADSFLGRAMAVAARTRTYGLVGGAWQRAAPARGADDPREILPAEVDAVLDYQGGLEPYHHDDRLREAVVAHYEFNLRRMIRTARDAGVPMLLVDPVSNLKDCPPFKIEHDAALPVDQRLAFDELWDAAREAAVSGDRPRAVELLLEAREIAPRHAGVRFYLGKCFERAWQYEAAEQEFLAAKDEDVCPLRMIEPLHRALARVAAENGTPLIAARREFAKRSPGGLVGDEWLVDHVHPSIEGHQLIARLLLDQMIAQGIVRPTSDAEPRRREAYQRHWDSLSIAYFERGKQRLEGQRLWTQGRARKIRLAFEPAP